MINYGGNLTESTTLSDSLSTLKDNIFSTLNVAEVCKVTNSQNQRNLITCTVLRDNTTIECLKLEDIDVDNDDLVLVVFTNTDNRKNIERINGGLNSVVTDDKDYHLKAYGVIVGRVGQASTALKSGKLMTANTFVNKAKLAANSKTLYCNGGIGQPLWTSNKNWFINNYWYNSQYDRRAKINAASADTFGFDCVGLVKAILWGWNGNTNAVYGGAGYASNGVPDVNQDGFLNLCTNVSSSFGGIVKGAFLWMQGHAGIYIGNGLAIECTPIWADGCQVTAVGNIGPVAGYNTRYWEKWGRIPYVQY